MKTKTLIFDEAARQAILRGVQTLSKAVSTTLGPKGRNVLIEKEYGLPIVTKDGVTVAKEVELADPYENMGAQMVREVANKTNNTAGDGTTTATVLAEGIYREGMKFVTAGANPVSIQRGIQKATNAAIEHLNTIATPIKNKGEIRQVAAVSANWDGEIADIIADALEKVGKDGTITVEEAKSIETTLDVVEGMQFDKGFVSPYFADAESQVVKFKDSFVLIYDKRISALKSILPVLQLVVNSGKPLLIIAEDIEGEALAALVVNKVRANLQVCAVKAPGFGDRRDEILRDIAVLTGAKVISEDAGLDLEKVQLGDLGMAGNVVVTKDATTIVEGNGKERDIQARVSLIRKQIEEATNDFEREKLQERLAKIAGGVAVINVGAATEAEMKEKKQRVDDALHATRAAVEEGIVPGGGVALIRCLEAIGSLQSDNHDEQMGIDIVKRAVESPLRALADNAGIEGSIIVDKVKNLSGNDGYNVATGKFENLIEAGVVDPKKVTRTALQNAASVAGLLLTTECIIVEDRKQQKSEVPQIPQQGY